MTDEIWFRFAVALFVGMLIGVERERSKGQGPTRREAGIRTFALAALLGAISLHLGGPLMLAVALAGVGVLVGIAYLRRQGDDPGLTTEVSLLLTVLVGGLALFEPLLSASVGVGLAIVLATKGPLHDFVRNVLTDAELRDGFLLAFATVVVWPALPDRPMGPYDAINPSKLWALVILVMAIGAAGHIATRALGGRYGLPLSGFASGFVSSAATVGAMGQRARDYPENVSGAVAGAALSTISTFVQMGVLLSVASPATALQMGPAILAGGLVAAAYGLWFTWRAVNDGDHDTPAGGSAFSLSTALLLAATLAAMLIAAAFLRDQLGAAGVLAGAALAGFADTHAAAISVATLVAGGKLEALQAVTPIMAAMTCNAITKALMALGAGSRSYSARVIPGLALSMAAAWAAAVLS
ncbi:MAG: MgtC/SapB family protein [Beijerinckiaceae bacterium]